MSGVGTETFIGSQTQLTEEEVNNAYYLATESMGHLNRSAAELMLKYKSNGATDITGFGILGHAENLAAAQFGDVDLVLEALPVFNKMHLAVDGMHDFGVMKGYSAETSGGILCIISADKADDYIKDSLETFGQTVWKVGHVVEGTKKAYLKDDIQTISIDQSFLT